MNVSVSVLMLNNYVVEQNGEVTQTKHSCETINGYIQFQNVICDVQFGSNWVIINYTLKS